MLKPEWKFYSSTYMPRKHYLIYRDDALGVQMQVVTKRKWILFRGKEKTYYFIDGDKRTFRTEGRLMHAVSKKRGGTTSKRHGWFSSMFGRTTLAARGE